MFVLSSFDRSQHVIAFFVLSPEDADLRGMLTLGLGTVLILFKELRLNDSFGMLGRDRQGHSRSITKSLLGHFATPVRLAQGNKIQPVCPKQLNQDRQLQQLSPARLPEPIYGPTPSALRALRPPRVAFAAPLSSDSLISGSSHV